MHQLPIHATLRPICAQTPQTTERAAVQTVVTRVKVALHASLETPKRKRVSIRFRVIYSCANVAGALIERGGKMRTVTLHS